MLRAALFLYGKLSSLGPLDISAPSMRHLQGTIFSTIRRDPNTLSLHCLFFSLPSRRRPIQLHADLLPRPAKLQGP
jgi:hypothetical protein